MSERSIFRMMFVMLLAGFSANARSAMPDRMTDLFVIRNGYGPDGVAVGGFANDPGEPDPLRPVFYFGAKDVDSAQAPTQLWISNGTAAGTRRLSTLPISRIVAIPEEAGAYFLARTEELGSELYFTDGTVTGTHLVRDLAPGPADGVLDLYGFLQGHLLYLDGTGGVSITDGTAAGTRQLSSRSGEVAVAENQAFLVTDFATTDAHLWRLGATPNETRNLLPPAGEASWYEPHRLAVFGDRMCFKAGRVSIDEIPMWTLYCTDGTQGGTVRITAPDGAPLGLLDTTYFQPFGTHLLLSVRTDGNSSLHPLVTDGSQAGSQVGALLALGHCAAGAGERAYLATSDFHLRETNASGEVGADLGAIEQALACDAGAGTESAHAGGVTYFLVGCAVMRTDGTVSGTYSLPPPPASVASGFCASAYWAPVVVGRHLIVLAWTNGSGNQFWSYDLDAVFADGFDP